MFKKPSTDMWRVAIATAPIETCLTAQVKPQAKTYLPDPGVYRFYADPFGLWRNNALYVFVEAYDYRRKHGTIECHVFDANLNHTAQFEILREAWHLSYPFVVEQAGAVYLLPEACRSGKLTLYKASDFPAKFEACAVLLNVPAVDPSLLFFRGKWWLFYSVKDGTESSALHAAYADHIEGPYTAYHSNPFYTAAGAARCGGTPFVHENTVYMPLQTSAKTYGDGVVMARLDIGETITATPLFGLASGSDGFHTLSQAGAVTLFDEKTIDRSWARLGINLQRRFYRLLKQR